MASRSSSPLRRRPFDRRGTREGDGTTSRRSTRGYVTSPTPPSRWGRDRESGGGGRSYESPPPLQLRRSGLPTARAYVVVVPSHAHRFVYYHPPPTHHLLLLRSQSVEDARCPRRRPCRSIPPARTEAREARAVVAPRRAMIERRWRSGRDRGRPKYDVRERDEGRGGTGGGGGGGGATTAIAAAATTTTGRGGGCATSARRCSSRPGTTPRAPTRSRS